MPLPTKTREVLENPSPPSSRFPSTLGKSLGRRGWISQYLPSFGGTRIHCENEDVIVSVIFSVNVIVIVIFSVAIHPDGLYIAAGFGDKIRLLNILIGSNSKS